MVEILANREKKLSYQLPEGERETERKREKDEEEA